MVQLQKLEEQQRISLSLQQQRHESEIRELEAALASSHENLERSQSDLEELRQNVVLLEEQREQNESLLNDLGLELSSLQKREQESTARLQDLEDALKATREDLAGRDADLTAAQARCRELERQAQKSERESSSRLRDLEDALKATREDLAGRDADLTAAQARCRELERQVQESARGSSSRLQGLEEERGDAASLTAGVPDGSSALSDLEIERLQEELVVLQQMLEDLPGIFEHKFRQRLQPVLEQRDWLVHENTWLRAKLPASRPALPSSPGSEPAPLSQAARRLGLNPSVQALLLLGRSVRRLRGAVRPVVDRHPDDAGPPTAA